MDTLNRNTISFIGFLEALVRLAVAVSVIPSVKKLALSGADSLHSWLEKGALEKGAEANKADGALLFDETETSESDSMSEEHVDIEKISELKTGSRSVEGDRLMLLLPYITSLESSVRMS